MPEAIACTVEVDTKPRYPTLDLIVRGAHYPVEKNLTRS